MSTQWRWLGAASAVAIGFGGQAAGADEIDFYRDVFPALKANCVSCHNKTTTKGGLNMESPGLLRHGGETGPGVLPGRSAESLVVRAAAHEDDDLLMPPKNNKSGAIDLSAAEIDVLKKWIDQGAKNSVQAARTVAWQPLPPGVNPIYTVAVSPDGRYAACGRSNQIFLYDLATRQFLTRLTDEQGAAHRSLVSTLAFSPDGTRLASGSFREVKIWRSEIPPTTGEAAANFAPPRLADAAVLKKIADTAKVAISQNAVSADGRRIVVGGADGSVRVWDVASGSVIAELRGTFAARQQIAALERTVAAQALELAFQNAETTRLETQNKALDELLKKAKDTILAMQKALPEKGKAVKPAQEAKAAAQKALDEVTALIAALPEGKPDAPLEKQQKDAHDKLASATMAETSALAAVAAAESNIQDAEAEVGRITAAKAANTATLAHAATAGDAAKKTQDKAKTDLTSAQQTLAKTGPAPLAVAFSADAEKVAALASDGSLQVWGVASGMPIAPASGGGVTATNLRAAADGTFTVTKSSMLTTDPALRWALERTLTDAKAGAPFADRVNAVRFSPDGKFLAVGGGEPSRSGDLALFEVASGKPAKVWSERHADAILCIDFSPDGKLLASGGADKIARVTELASGRQVNLFEGHTHHVMGVAFRADGRVLATAGGDGTVLVWDMILGERKKKIDGWTKEVTSLQYIGATSQIVTSAGDNLIRIVNDDGTVVRAIDKLPDFMQSAASTATGEVIIGGGEDSWLRVWDGATGRETAAFGPK